MAMTTGSALRVVGLIIAGSLLLAGCTTRPLPVALELTPEPGLETLVGVLPADRTISTGCSAEGTWGSPGFPSRAEAVQELIEWYQRENARLRPDAISDPALPLEQDRIRQLALFRGLEAVMAELPTAESTVGAGDSVTASGSIDGVPVGEVAIEPAETGGYQVTRYETVGFVDDHSSCASEGALSSACGGGAVIDYDGSPGAPTRTKALEEYIGYADESWLAEPNAVDADLRISILIRGFSAALESLPEAEAGIADDE
jgi:hypothetical protein